MMTGHDVLRVLDALYVNGVSPIVEGGWGVDALLGRQTRSHVDADLLIYTHEQADALNALDGLGYDHIVTLSAGRLSLSQPDGRSVDLHLIDAEGTQQTPVGPFQFPEVTLHGRGLIVGRPVRCLTMEGQVLIHAAHDLSEAARNDLYLMADQLGARLYYPLARGIDMVCRHAEESDLPAMAMVLAEARRLRPIREAPSTGELSVDAYWRYWHKRLQLPGTIALVITVGDAIAATVATSAWQGGDLPDDTAALYGLAKYPSNAVDHLDELLIQRARAVSQQQGFANLCTWVDEQDSLSRALFERSGWSTDGARFEIVPGLGRVRYAAR